MKKLTYLFLVLAVMFTISAYGQEKTISNDSNHLKLKPTYTSQEVAATQGRLIVNHFH